MSRAALVVSSLLALPACIGPTPTRIAESTGVAGWHRLVGLDGSDAGRRPPTFEKVALGVASPPCAALSESLQAEGPVLVAVHGVGGDNEEWTQALPDLTRAYPAATFLLRWVPYDERDELAQRLATGLNRLLACTARDVVVVAHSAGGVLSSFGASQVAVPPGRSVTLLTVASPLAGTVFRAQNADGRQEVRFMLDLGSRIAAYPPAAHGVQVLHLRTRAPADHVMKPTSEGHHPNDPAVRVPGAQMRDLPEGLGHVEALPYVARRIVESGGLGWISELPSPVPSAP